MAESRIVANAERSPSGCVACGRHEGPFMDFDLQIYQMATHEGAADVDGSLYLCIGTPENPGCLPQWARKTGLDIDLLEHERVLVHVAELENEVERLTAISKKRTLSLADAESLLLR